LFIAQSRRTALCYGANMSWLSEAWTVPSEFNGIVECRRALGQWTVTVNGCSESSGYMYGLWKQGIKHLPKKAPIKRILMLGLAAGCSIETLHRRFPGVHITAIEWDPVMIQVMDRLKLFRPIHRPEIIIGDAAHVIPTLNKKFDLILFDLYQGPTSPENVKHQHFFKALQPLLQRDGFLIVNAYAQTEMFATARTSFAEQSHWKYHLNYLALYRAFGAGTIGDPLPKGYVQFRSNHGYLERDLTTNKNSALVGTKDAPGFRRWNGPCCIEKYYGDTEPKIDPKGPKRLIIWQPTQRLDKPVHWRRSLIQMNAQITGFVDLNGGQDPFTTWTPHAQRHLKRWLAQSNEWEFIKLTLEQFIPIYMSSSMSPSLKELHREIIERKSKAHGDIFHLFGFKRKSTGKIEAGLATLDIPELNQSIHIASFILDSAKNDPIGIGMIELWFKDAQQRKIRFLDFDLFRGPGDPKEWKGFSRFKAQFGTYFIRYPNPLIRWEGTWKEYLKHFR